MNTAQPVSFVHTRSRANDCDTSQAAANHATTGKASNERLAITKAIKAAPSGLTAREVAMDTGIDYHTVQRRIAECGLTKTNMARVGGRVWVAV